MFCHSLLNGQSGIILLAGHYQGKVLYVQNPSGLGSVGFCVTEVKVNGRIAKDETNSSAFEIDLKSYDLSIGDRVEIQIFHKEGCIPKVLNPEVLKPKSTYEIIAMSADKEGTLQWTTKSETGKLSFYIEQFRWNKWVRVGEIEGTGSPLTNEYVFKVSPHSGKNQLRLRQTDYTNSPRLSKTVEFTSDTPEVDFSPIKASKEINFFIKGKEPSMNPTETMYEVYDQYGNNVKKGAGLRLDVSNLPKGSYFINFDNKMGEFVKK